MIRYCSRDKVAHSEIFNLQLVQLVLILVFTHFVIIATYSGYSPKTQKSLSIFQLNEIRPVYHRP